MDPLQALTAALSVPADSKEQADLLAALRETLEAQPHPIPILCNTLLKTAAGSNDSLLRRWVLDLLHFGIARAPLAVDTRTNRAFWSTLNFLLLVCAHARFIFFFLSSSPSFITFLLSILFFFFAFSSCVAVSRCASRPFERRQRLDCQSRSANLRGRVLSSLPSNVRFPNSFWVSSWDARR
jgi:hypothetical protein